MKPIIVCDAVCGAGKTEWMIRNINESPNTKKFIVITQYLEQHKRFKVGCPKRQFKEPDILLGNRTDLRTKLPALKELVKHGENIVSTHALFTTFDDELLELLNEYEYHLMLDEVSSVSEIVKNLTQRDIKALLSGTLALNGNKVVLVDQSEESFRYSDVVDIARSGNLYHWNATFFLWCFPKEIFECFESVMVFTYLFHLEKMSRYFALHNIPYIRKTLVNGSEIVDWTKENELTIRRDLKQRIHIVDNPKYNNVAISTIDNPLSNQTGSSGWFDKCNNDKHGDMTAKEVRMTSKRYIYQRSQLTKLKNNMRAVFRSLDKNVEDVFWTVPKAFSGQTGDSANARQQIFADSVTKYKNRPMSLAPKGYVKYDRVINEETDEKETVTCYVPLNMRATNAYKDCTACAYCYNRYLNPGEANFYEALGMPLNEDGIATSDLIQFIFRGAIRNPDGEITVYLPFPRMRQLLIDYLDGKDLA